MFVEIGLAKLSGPSIKVWSTFHHAVNVIGVAVPDDTVELYWFGFIVVKCGVEIEAGYSIPPESEIAVPLRGGGLAAILFLSFLPGLRFLRSFMLMRNEKWWGYIVRGGKVDERVIGIKDKGEGLVDGGNRSVGHGDRSRDRSVNLVLGDGRRTETCDKNSDGKKCT
jgi:hypothetical protein